MADHRSCISGCRGDACVARIPPFATAGWPVTGVAGRHGSEPMRMPDEIRADASVLEKRTPGRKETAGWLDERLGSASW